MILELTYEELTAVNRAAERLRGTGGGVAAPPEAIRALEHRLPLEGDIRVSSAVEHTGLLLALDAILEHLRERMDRLIVEQYVGAEDAVNAYFEYANVLTLRTKLVKLGREMMPS